MSENNIEQKPQTSQEQFDNWQKVGDIIRNIVENIPNGK